jgi:biofilm PGA synthesis protein PgaA
MSTRLRGRSPDRAGEACRRAPGGRRRPLIAALALAMGCGAALPALAQAAGPVAPSLAAAQALRARGQRMEALAACEDVLAARPHDREALWLEARLLAELGAAGRAAELAGQAGDAPAAALARADLAAHEVRWSRADPADPRHPYAEADAAVAGLDEVVRRAPGTPGADQAEIDRLVAYDEAGRGAEAVAAYRALRHAGHALPAYAEVPMADALLGQRRPEEAIPLFEQGIRHDPGPYPDDQADPRIGLSYAYLEAGRPRDALALIDHAAAATPPWLPGSPPRPSPHKADADLNAALIRAYVWMLDAAWRRLAAMLAQAPLDADLWREQGELARMRGWPRRSEDALATAAGIDPDDVAVRVALAADWRDLYDYPRVEPALRQAEAVAPRDTQVRQARDEWERERGWQFDLEHDRGKGNAPDFGDRDHETQATLQSPLLGEHWRIYGVTRLSAAALPEGQAERERLGLGVRGYLRGLEAYVQALPAVGSDTRRTALEAGLRWLASDHWTFAADWSNTGDADVPLRAAKYGITAHALDVSAQWRASELTAVTLAGSRDRFSDGNRRTGWQATLVQRLHTAPYFTLDGGVELGQERNGRTDVPYYSPSCARWAMATGRVENLLAQHYGREWRQRIDVAAGVYDECRYGSDWSASVRYGQTFQPRGGLAFGWGLGWASQPYDGHREARVMLDLTLHWGE